MTRTYTVELTEEEMVIVWQALLESKSAYPQRNLPRMTYNRAQRVFRKLRPILETNAIWPWQRQEVT